MIDEYVEHTVPLSGTQAQNSMPLPPLHYEGFEPTPYEGDDARAEAEDSSFDNNATNNPVFELSKVQYTLPAPLVSFVVSSDLLAMGLATNTIVLIELSHAEQVVKVQIQRNPKDMSIYKLFMDPSGRHIIITSLQGENWYLYRSWKRPRHLKGLKMVIESIGWNKNTLISSHSTSTREILIGTKNGVIYEAVLDAEEDFFKSQERYLQSVFTLPERHPITGIKFEHFPPTDPKKSLVIVTTPTRIYQFTGPIEKKTEDVGKVFNGLFTAYRDTAPKILELPGNLQHSELHIFSPNPDQALSFPKKIAWMTAQGIYHGYLNSEIDSEDHIDSAALLPYPVSSDSEILGVPISICLTEFHSILLYKGRLVALCNLDDRVAYEEVLPTKSTEVMLGLASDPVRKTYWAYSDQSLFELVIGNEDRDVWKIYLDKGQYDVALRYSKTARQRDEILLAQANTLFENGHFFQAAQSYSHCSATFEEVALKFLDLGERDALRSYLISRLERTRKSDYTQKMILSTWLVEFYLSKCNELDDIVASECNSHEIDIDNLRTEKSLIEEDLRRLFETYKNNLNRQTAYSLILGHGRTDIYLFYASAIGDFERVIEHWIIEEQWSKAIEVISRQSNLDLYYRFSPVLMRQAPKEIVDCWMRQPSLDTLKLIPSLLQHQYALRDPLAPNQAIRYLNHVIFEKNCVSPTIHNLLITYYVLPSTSCASVDEDGSLLRFLINAPTSAITGKPFYDLDYALRICKIAGRTQSCVHIYAKMGLWENSVDMALEKGDLELAKINANMPEDDEPLRKKLWLKIARYVVQDKKDIKSAMRFLENTDLLKIEDILPFFPDFVVIDDFKEEIAHALEGYSTHINALKEEMDEATKTAESIKEEIASLKNRFITIDSNDQCSSCSTHLLSRQFYVFPCHHIFHADCLIGLAKDYLPAHALRRIVVLQNELMKHTPKGYTNGAKPPSISNLPSGRQPATQRTLLSANFAPIINPLQSSAKAANLLGRSVITAGDRLRDMIVPDALATLVLTPNWLPGVGSNRASDDEKILSSNKLQTMRDELVELLSSSCPLCETVVAGLDKPFVMEGEGEATWTL